MSLGPHALRKHVQTIVQIHPWYEKLAAEYNGLAAFEPDQGNPLYSLRKLPLLTAGLLEKHYYAQSPQTTQTLTVYRTSGTSTGIRKTIYYSSEDDVHYIAAKQASFEAWLSETSDRSAPIKRALADLGTGHAASTALRIFAGMGLEGEAIPFSSPLHEHIAKLQSFRPELLYTMPSLLEAIADAWPAGEPFMAKKIILVGEMASREWQANMAARLGLTPLDLLDTYGSIEAGAIASYSHELDRYVLSDGIWGEGLTIQELGEPFEPLADNERVLALTSLNRSLFPVVRFVTYDVVRDFKVIDIKGTPRGTFSSIVKRIGPELKHGEKISLYDIEEAVHRVLKDAVVRVAVNGNRLSLHIRSAELRLRPEKRQLVQDEVERRIPDIGAMIRGGLLYGIDVIPADERHPLPEGSIKSKKIYG